MKHFHPLTMKVAPHLYARLQQWQDDTGATYTSAATAALLAFFSLSDEERRLWCNRYAALGRNEITLDQATAPLRAQRGVR